MEVITGFIIIAVIVLAVRFFGAWMLRINDLIKIQNDQIVILKKILNKLND